MPVVAGLGKSSSAAPGMLAPSRTEQPPSASDEAPASSHAVSVASSSPLRASTVPGGGMRPAPSALMRREATVRTGSLPLIGAVTPKSSALVSDIGALNLGSEP